MSVIEAPPAWCGRSASASTATASREEPVVRLGLGRRRMLRGVILHLVLMVMAAIYLVPLAYMVWRSFSTTDDALAAWSNGTYTLDHFKELDRRTGLGRLMLNTTIVTVARVVLQVPLSIAAGFAIAQIRFGGRRFAFGVLVGAAMAPLVPMLIPLVVMVDSVGLYNSWVGLVAPTVVSGVGVLLFVQVFRGLPPDMVDAARVDGCAPWRVMWHVAIPHARATVVAFALLVTIYSWNEFLWASTATTGDSRRVLTVAVAHLADQSGWSDPGVQMAAACVGAVPIVVFVVVMSRWFGVHEAAPYTSIAHALHPRRGSRR